MMSDVSHAHARTRVFLPPRDIYNIQQRAITNPMGHKYRKIAYGAYVNGGLNTFIKVYASEDRR